MVTPALQVANLGKRYTRGLGSHHDSLRDAMRSICRRSLSPQGQKSFWALRDATFDVLPGENVGIVGLNGAGKSTLLKILSRITAPTTGQAVVNGRIGALLEVGTGFHPELTGRENIFLYGAILGMSRQEIAAKLDAIIDFAEIAVSIDSPVKRYSSGMYVRLAFSVAAHLDPEILLLDEVLAVGDGNFQRKCMNFSAKLQQRGSTILVVSHNMFSIKTMCKRVIYLRHGKIVFDGPTEHGLRLYEEDCRLARPAWFTPDESDGLTVEDVAVSQVDGSSTTIFDHGSLLRVRVNYSISYPIKNPNFHISFVRSDGTVACNFSSEMDGVCFNPALGRNMIEVTMPPLKLVPDSYTVEIVVRERNYGSIICAQVGTTIHVRHPVMTSDTFGLFHESGTWRTLAVS